MNTRYHFIAFLCHCCQNITRVMSILKRTKIRSFREARKLKTLFLEKNKICSKM